MSSKTMNVINEKDVPYALRSKSPHRIEQLLKIPKGKAWEITEEEAHMKLRSLRVNIQRWQKHGLLPGNYRVVIIKNKAYIINTKKE